MIEKKLTELTEREGSSVKKSIDSNLLIKGLYKRESLFKFRLFGREFNLGSKDISNLSQLELRDIKIYLSNEVGNYHVEWGSEELGRKLFGDAIPSETYKDGIIIRFEAIASNEKDQLKIYELEEKRRVLRSELNQKYPEGKIPLRQQMKVFEISASIGDLKSAIMSDPIVNTTILELTEELKQRYDTKGTPSTSLLRKIFTKKLKFFLVKKSID